MTADELIDAIVKREAGFVDHPHDKGGPTNWGITQATLSDWRGRPCTRDDVRALTPTEARSIYRTQYISAPGFDRLPDMLRAHVVDFGVTSNHINVIKTLQRAINPLPVEGLPDVVAVDGVLGPKTLAAIHALNERALVVRLCQERVRYYGWLAIKDHTQADFYNGWLNRVYGMWPA